jgi:hypothetical protein
LSYVADVGGGLQLYRLAMNMMKNNIVLPAWGIGQGLTTHLTKNGVLRKVALASDLKGFFRTTQAKNTIPEM